MDENLILSYLNTPKTVYQICAEFNKGYTTIYHALKIMKVKGLVNNHKGVSKTVWFKTTKEAK